MHNWKIFLEQDKEYISEDLHIHMEAELDELSFEEQVGTLDSAIQGLLPRVTVLTCFRGKRHPPKVGEGKDLAAKRKGQTEGIPKIDSTNPYQERKQE
jgi:hypothetical protein